MDYCLEATKANIKLNREFRNILFERMEIESQFMTSCLEDFHIMLEDGNDTTKSGDGGLWDKIKNFFASIFGIFKSKTEGLFATHKKWLDDNYNKFDKIDYTNIEIEMIPFWWDPDLNKCKGIVNQLEEKLKAVAVNKNNTKQYKSIDDLKKELLKDYLDENGDLTNGLKNLYRVGNAKGPLKTVSNSGDALKKQAMEMRDYCYNYGKDVTTYVSNLMRKSENEVQTIEKMMKTAPIEPTKEGFCLVENAFYKDTELAYCDNFAVLEANTNDNNNKETDKNKDGTTRNPTEVNVVDKNDKKQNEANEIKQQYKGQGYNQLAFAKAIVQVYQLSITALMTVLEERFRAYLKALIHIKKTGGDKVDGTPQENNPTNVVVKKGKVK